MFVNDVLFYDMLYVMVRVVDFIVVFGYVRVCYCGGFEMFGVWLLGVMIV